MNHRDQRVCVLAGLAMTFAGAGGCVFLVPLSSPAGVPAYYAAASFPQGPRAQFVNESTLPLTVRYWVGRRDITARGGVADVRTGDELAFTALPGDHFITALGRPESPVFSNDAVVWVRVDGTGSDVPTWLQLEQPGPFTWRAAGDATETLIFERAGGGPLSPLPKDRWIAGNNGPFPEGGPDSL